MKAQCLPFSQIPHVTRLFTDFLAGASKIQPFYPRSPRLSEWCKDETSRLRYDAARRERVADILDRQNRVWGASAKTLENLARLRAGAATVVTGQQVGLFGGPSFSLFKALTAVKLASEATAAGVESVPLFWLATEDHDLDEVNHVSVPGPDWSLQKLTADVKGVAGAPVGTEKFGAEIEALTASAAALLGENDILALLRESYHPGETMGSAFARLFSGLFGEWGVVLLDASDPELHAVAAPIYRAAIERSAEIDDALLARGNELESAGYHQQVKVTPSSTLVFTLRNGARVPIHRKGNDFVVEDEKISRTALLDRIQAAPESFSANVLLRPVIQDHLLPTLAYSGGAAEIAYFAQAAVVYEALLGRVTPIVPRFSATIVEPKPQALLEKYGLSFPDLFQGPAALREAMAARVLPREMQSAFDEAGLALEKSMSAVSDALGQLDKTLVDAAGNATSKMQHQLEQLRGRAARAELQKSEVVARKAEMLSNALYPNKTLQEREIAGIYFLARHGRDLLHQLYGSIHPDCLDHQLLIIAPTA